MHRKCRRYILISTLLFFAKIPTHVVAYILSDTKTATISATVPSQHVDNDTTAPSAPILIRPEDGTITGDNKGEFVWHQSTDPNGNTLTYTLYLNGVATYLGISNIGNSGGTGYSARRDGEEVKLVPTVALADGTYDWYVTATDLAGNTSHSTNWHFTVDTTPPPLTVIDVDTYHQPAIQEGSNFDIPGPKNVNFTILSDPHVTIQLTLTPSSEPCASECLELLQLQSLTNSSGLAYFTPHLNLGIYHVTLVAIDQAGNTYVLPDFTLNISEATLVIQLPLLPGLAGHINIPYTPLTIPSLPTTIAKLQTRDTLTTIISIALAIIGMILLIFLWKRKKNILILDPKGNPLKEAIIYHSIPQIREQKTKILLTSQDPIEYSLTKLSSGKLYIRRLNRYSTLTIRTTTTTYLLSICRHRSFYTLILG